MGEIGPDQVASHLRRKIGLMHEELGKAIGRVAVDGVRDDIKDTPIDITRSAVVATPYWGLTSIVAKADADSAESYDIYSGEDLAEHIVGCVKDTLENLDSQGLQKVGVPWAEVKRR